MEDKTAQEGGSMKESISHSPQEDLIKGQSPIAPESSKASSPVSKSAEKAAIFLRAATVAALLNSGFPIGGASAETQKSLPPAPKEEPNLIQKQGMPSQNLERKLNELGATVETSQTIREAL